MLKRIQVTIAILAGMTTLAVGVSNVKHTVFAKHGPGNVIVQVRTETGQPVRQAAIEITKAQGGVVSTAETGSEGTYAKNELEPGTYTLKADKHGFQSNMLVFTIEPGQTVELTLTLAASSSSIRSAMEEVGASWIKDLGMPRTKSEGTKGSNPLE